jgi:hypothetical protein
MQWLMPKQQQQKPKHKFLFEDSTEVIFFSISKSNKNLSTKHPFVQFLLAHVILTWENFLCYTAIPRWLVFIFYISHRASDTAQNTGGCLWEQKCTGHQRPLATWQP